jgi:hypothetical protein
MSLFNDDIKDDLSAKLSYKYEEVRKLIEDNLHGLPYRTFPNKFTDYVIENKITKTYITEHNAIYDGRIFWLSQVQLNIKENFEYLFLIQLSNDYCKNVFLIRKIEKDKIEIKYYTPKDHNHFNFVSKNKNFTRIDKFIRKNSYNIYFVNKYFYKFLESILNEFI